MKDRLYQPTVLRALMDRHTIRAKKGFGQNFLIDRHALEEIIDAVCGDDDAAQCSVLEVGPGLGTLTQALCEEGFAKVLTIEKDTSLVPILQETLGDYDNVDVHFGDALSMDLEPILAKVPAGSNLCFAANLPYYITTPLLMRFLEAHVPFRRMVIMVQKEVAQRLTAHAGTKEYGAITVAVQYYATPRIVTIVPAGSFMPKPNVDSAVVALAMKEQRPLAENPQVEMLFFRVVKAAFAMRRKTLHNALRAEFSHLGKEGVQAWLGSAMIDPQRRGETLTLEEFLYLTNKFPIME